MAKTVDLKAVNVQLEADKAGLEASARKKNNALGNISCMWLEVPPTSGIVEEPAAVYAAWLAQLPFRLAKKGSETVPFAPLHLWLINLLMQPVSNLSLERVIGIGLGCEQVLQCFVSFLELSNIHPQNWLLHHSFHSLSAFIFDILPVEYVMCMSYMATLEYS